MLSSEEYPGNPAHCGNYEAHPTDQGLFLKARRVLVSRESLLTDSDAAEVAIVFTPKEGECGSLCMWEE